MISKKELIEDTYSEVIKGIQEDWFFSEYDYWYKYVVNLMPRLRTSYLIVVFHNQIFNGGFHQYYVNGYGQFVNETIEALITIGAVKRASLLRDAHQLVNENNEALEVFRRNLLRKQIRSLFFTDELFLPLDKLDTLYYAIEDEDVEILLGGYLERTK